MLDLSTSASALVLTPSPISFFIK